MKWNRQKFTFMVIPDANSQVVRFRIPAVLLVGALVLAIALAALAAAALILYGNRRTEVMELKQKMAASAVEYEKTISDKDRQIGDLQTEVAGLSVQAKTIQDKMADIGVLETQLKQIAGLKPSKNDSPGNPKAEKTETDRYALNGSAGDGKGGEELPVTEMEMNELLANTRDDFLDLGSLIDRMKPRLQATKDAVLKQQARLRVTPTIWPVDSRRITSTFGVRKDPFTNRARFHSGMDIAGDTGNPVFATADGTVTYAGFDGENGNNIWISHGNGITTHYSHLSKILVEPGTKVRKGDLIGKMGSTGRSTGPHLHYEVKVSGALVDPQPFLQADRKDD